ncbi:MAG: hypothetical protein IV093_02420 [Rubrivivax sp.]|nr:hypothetical protein [Rubrivivax sp.]
MSAVMTLSTSPRRRRWPLALTTLVLLALGAALLAWGAISALNPMPVNLSIDGEQIFTGLDLAGMPPAHKVVLAALLAFVMLAALVIVPVALMLGLVALLVAVLAIVGLPLLAVAAVLAVVLAPLWLLGWLVWKAITC